MLAYALWRCQLDVSHGCALAHSPFRVVVRPPSLLRACPSHTPHNPSPKPATLACMGVGATTARLGCV
ncbi:MAG: hypothetical protein K2W33_16070, partial [Burkholderiales bacterium]|nr:hypothetical protein [Burkholderiales bacterium]